MVTSFTPSWCVISLCEVAHVFLAFFVFQAEDGIRAGRVTGVQTCALPIWAVRRTECTLDEYGPGTFPAYKAAEIVSVRAETLATLLQGALPHQEAARLAEMFQSGTPLDPPDDGTPEESGPATEEDPPRLRHSSRSPREELIAQRAKFLIRQGGHSA